MALTYDQITAITQKKFIPKMYDNIFDSNPLLKRAKDKGWYDKLDGGERIVVPLLYAQTSASGWYAGSDTLDTTDNQNISAAEYTWKQLYANITIRRDEELKNSGDSQILSLVKNKMKIAEKTMSDLLGTGLFNDGSDAKAIVGLRSILGTANTVGGISQSTNSWWQAKVDSTSTVLTIPVMQTLHTQCTVDNDSPSVGIATRTIYDLYYNLLQPQQRFSDSESAKGGFTSLMFNGFPILADSHAPASHLVFLNEDYLNLWVHKDEDMRMEPFTKPINQNVKSAKIYFMGALGSCNNRLHAKFSAIAG
jgi:hypothetical protein